MEGMVDVKGVGVTDVKLAEAVAVDVLEAEVVNVTAAVVDAYDLLANELGLIYKCSVEIIPYVMTWDGIVIKYHKTYVKRLQIPINVEAYIQSIVLKKTVETISFDRRRGLESG
ncbi:hypothetical protein CWI39_1847p0010, partial [Hamiltosporidium magnivora]